MSVRKASKGIHFATMRLYYLRTRNFNVNHVRLTPKKGLTPEFFEQMNKNFIKTWKT